MMNQNLNRKIAGNDQHDTLAALEKLAQINEIPDSLRLAARRQITRIQLGIFKEDT